MTVLAVGAYTSNADLIAACFQLGYLADDRRTLDPTYGLGRFWKTRRPVELVASDLDITRSPVGASIDFTALPWDDADFDDVVFDPPYKLCLDGQTDVLTRRGWLTWAQLEAGDLVYSLDHDTGEARWAPVTAVNVFAGPHDVEVCDGKNLNFVATDEHRWPVLDARGRRIWRTTATLAAGDRVIKAAALGGRPTEPVHSDALVELVAWYWTEGHLERPSHYGHIAQSHAVNSPFCQRIAECFRAEFGVPVDRFDRQGRRSSPAWRIHGEERLTRFVFSAAIGRILDGHAPGRVPTLAFLESLTAEQLDLFIEVSLLADGQSDTRLTQKSREAAEQFALACLIAGRSVSMHWRPDGNGHVVTIVHGLAKPPRPGLTRRRIDGIVWCPTVEGTSTFLARRAGSVYFTGNSGTPDSGGPANMDDSYGIRSPSSWQDRHALIRAGIDECARVLRPGGHLLIKCQDQVCSGRVRWQTREFADHAEGLGCTLVDALLLVGHRQQPPGRRQVHARRNYSTLLVCRKGPA